MELTRHFTKLGRNDAPIAGGKGASLGEMTQAGIPVPPGFVVLSNAFERFIEETDLNVEIDAELHKVNHKEIHTVERASEVIRALILAQEMPKDIADDVKAQFAKLDAKYVAVRSSATAEDGADHAWAGQLESYLNTTEDDVLDKVKRCWSSLFTPRAIFYRFEKGLHASKISVAVVVQKMVDSEVSGIAFSVHPVTEDWNQLIIEAGFGLGEAIVSGQVTPDSYVVEKEPRRIIDINVSTQERGLYRANKPSEHGWNEWRDIAEPKASSQVLTEPQVNELSNIIIGIEKHYGFPCDIEWAFEAGKFYIVQSRPITTLAPKNTSSSNLNVSEKLKKTDCQIDWSGKFSLAHCSLAMNGYFNTFNKIFGKNLTFAYLSYTKGIATAYLPALEYQELGMHLAEKAKNADFRKEWINQFKGIADKIQVLLKKLHPETFFDNLNELKSLYDNYTAYQVATKTASNFLSQKEDEEIFKEFEGARKYSETLFHDADIIISDTIDVIVKKTPGYTRDQLLFATVDELSEVIDKNIQIDSSVLQERYERSGIFSDKNGYKILDPKTADDIENTWSNIGEDGVLKGNTAFPGLVKGKVRILKNHKGHIEEGEILVTSMTDPNFVPLMQKAAAIVTDGGGLLCHAAIVARELNKPCVIGTKFGTKVLKDGMMIEVDAEKGIIRILKSEGMPTSFITPELKDFDTSAYHFDGLWKNDLFATCFWQDCWVPDVVERLKLDMSSVGVMNLKGGHYLVEKAVRARVDAQIKRMVDEKNEAFFKNLVKVSDEIFMWGMAKGEELRTKEATLENFRDFVETAKRLNFLWLIGATYTNWPTEEKLGEAIIEDKFPPEHALDIIPKIITPLSEYQQGVAELRKRVGSKTFEEVRADTELFEKLRIHAEKYAWIEMINFIGELLTPERLYEQVTHTDKETGEHPAFTPKKPLSPKLQFVAQCMSDVGYVKQAGAEYFSMFTERVLPFLHKVTAKIGVTYRELMCLSTHEIDKALQGTLKGQELKSRAARRIGVNDWALIGGKDGKPIFTEELADVKLMLEKMIPKTGKDAKELIGQIGNRGNYVGPARVIMNTYDFGKMQPGDVLVSTMTTPDFVILMQKAGAIVTDIGGLLCHAAIVSREINKPCVIGTKFATQILKDGMMVEVDGDKGVVKIIS